VAGLEETVRETVVQVLDAAPAGTEIDAVEQLTAPIPVLVIAALLAVQDGDRHDFRRWSDAMIEYADSRDQEDMKLAGELYGFFAKHVRARMASPGDDLVSVLAQASFQGESLSMEQILMFCMTLLVAGNETTRHLLSGGLLALDQHPDQKTHLASDPRLVPGACEEMLRWVTPIRAMGRTPHTDVTIGGVEIPAGDFVVMLYASANRDERVWGPTGSAFDVTRPVSTTHVAFGFGEHLCLGAALARLEARVFFEELLARYPHYAVSGEPQWTESTLVNGPKRLPVVLAP
jgi:cytochrome P450